MDILYSQQETYKPDTVELKVSYDNGVLSIPDEVKTLLGIKDGMELRLAIKDNKVEIMPNIHSLSRVYIEPTSKCNLMCHTCIRNTWDEPMGEMSIEVFDKLVEDLRSFKHLQSVMFGGFGEPAAHRQIAYMIKKVKSLGVRVEMVTNGTLLDEKMLKELMESRLDILWVSFDGTGKEKFEDVREGANYNSVINNLRVLKFLNERSENKIQVGIAFVAMKQNISELNNMNYLARIIGAKYISISNVLPYSKEMQDQLLYENIICDNTKGIYPDDIVVRLPRFAINDLTEGPLFKLIRRNTSVYFTDVRINTGTEKCRFINDRCTFIRWDGMVCPCMGLLHSHTTYLNGYERKIESYTLGSIQESCLSEIWNSGEYADFREKVNNFEFSPCYLCGGCDNLESNKEDCTGNKHPCCGGCMWAQGVIQCP